MLLTIEAMQQFSSLEVDQRLRTHISLLRRTILRLTHEAAVAAVAFSPDGRTLATGSGDKTAWMSFWQPADMIAAACARLSRNLTPKEWKQYLGDEPYRKACVNLSIGAGFFDEERRLAK